MLINVILFVAGLTVGLVVQFWRMRINNTRVLVGTIYDGLCFVTAERDETC